MRIRTALPILGLAAGAGAYSRFLRSLAPELAGQNMAVTTTDGWNLSVRRYPATNGAGQPRRGVVVAGHGFAGTSLIWDLMPEVSLARHLAAAGFDFYAVDLRGRAGSWPDGGPNNALQWSFDDFVERDLPAAVTEACARSDTDHVTWLGLEMSGQAAYAAAISATAPEMTSVITLGSPVLTPPTAKVPGVTSAPRARRQGRVQFWAGAHYAGPVLALLRSKELESSFRPPNVDPVVPARYLRHGIPNESVVLADQFLDWVQNDTMRSLDHTTVWSDQLASFTLPVLALAASRDLQRPPEAVKAGIDALGSTDKQFVEVGRASGYRVDYGHDDLVAARTSPAEVFPLITDWLAAHH